MAEGKAPICIDLAGEEDEDSQYQSQPAQLLGIGSKLEVEVGEDHNLQDRNAMMLKRKLWLIRIPPDVHEQWKLVADGGSVGRMTLTQNSFQADPSIHPPEMEVCLTLTDSADSSSTRNPREGGSSSGTVTNIGGGGNSSSAIFNKYKLIPGPVTPIASNNGLFIAHTSSETEAFHVAGTIGKKFKAFPVRNDAHKEFMKKKKELSKQSQQPIQLERAVNCYKPVANHQHNIEYDKKKKLEGRKMRGEKEEVAQILFKAFESHQFYSYKDLMGLTNQPARFLKEILEEYCNYTTKGVHRSLWELKPEYRHYGEDD